MRIRPLFISITLVLLAWTAVPIARQSADARLLQEAIDLIESAGDYPAALAKLETAARSADRSVAARALWQAAQIHERTDAARARRFYTRLVADYADMLTVTNAARERIAALDAAAAQARPAAATAGEPVERRLVGEDGFRVEGVSDDGRSAIGRSASTDLVYRDLTTGEMRVLVQGGGWQWPQLSRDGRQVAYGVMAAGRGVRAVGLRVVDTAPGGATRVLIDLPNGPTLLPQAWSPNGSEILVMRGSGANGSPTAPGAMQVVWVSATDGAIRPIRTFEPWQNPNGFALSHDGKWIAYDDVPEPPADRLEHHVFVMDRDGANPTPVATLAGANTEARWGADDTHLVFLQVQTGGTDLFAVPVANGAAAGEPVRLKAGVTRGLKTISPTGTLFYRKQVGNDFVTVVADRAGDGAVVRQSFAGSRAALSPDGSAVAFLRYLGPRDGARFRRFELIVRSLDTGAEQAYPVQGIDRLTPILWTNDGRHLLLGATLTGTDGREQDWVIRLSLRTGTITPLISVSIAGRAGWSRTGALSADDRTMYLTASRVGRSAVTDIVAVDLATGAAQPVAQLPDGGLPAIDAVDPLLALSPNGRMLALQVVDGPPLRGRLFVVGTDGAGFRQLSGPTLQLAGRPQWTPDGSAVIVPSLVDGVTWTMRIPLDGSAPRFDGLDVSAISGQAGLPVLQPGSGVGLTTSRDGRRLAIEVTSAAQVELWAIEHVLGLAGRRRP